MLSKPQFRPFISRTQRFIRFWRTRPRFWMNVYPLQFWSYLLLGVPSTIVFLIKAYQRAPTGGTDSKNIRFALNHVILCFKRDPITVTIMKFVDPMTL